MYSPEKHKTCDGPNAFWGQCGSLCKCSAPNYCAGLAWNEKICVLTMLESPSVPQDSSKKKSLLFSSIQDMHALKISE